MPKGPQTGIGLKESAPDCFTIGPFLSISFVTGVQPWQLHTADVLSEQLFICLFRHPTGDLSVAFSKKKEKKRPRAVFLGEASERRRWPRGAAAALHS